MDKTKTIANPDNGIPLRGPLSQLFSALYLKPLGDAMAKVDVFYLRHQDDGVILCKSRRQLNCCKQKVMSILEERKPSLSRKKTRIGLISEGGHFLGINYLGLPPQDNIAKTWASEVIQINNKIKGEGKAIIS